jgi:hypothetical protein
MRDVSPKGGVQHIFTEAAMEGIESRGIGFLEDLMKELAAKEIR